MLSERAKGKQRAVDLPLESSRELVVRFTEGAPDLTITVDKAESVKNVKKRVSPLQFSLFILHINGIYRFETHAPSCTTTDFVSSIPVVCSQTEPPYSTPSMNNGKIQTIAHL
jgi:hypothetical protein